MFRSWLFVFRVRKIQAINFAILGINKMEFVLLEKIAKLLLKLKHTFFSSMVYFIFSIINITWMWNFAVLGIVHYFNRIYDSLTMFFLEFYNIQISAKDLATPYLMIILITIYCLWDANFINKKDSKAYLYIQYLKMNPSHYYKIKHLEALFTIAIIILNTKLYLPNLSLINFIMMFCFSASFATLMKFWFLLEYVEKSRLKMSKYLTSFVGIVICSLIGILFNINIMELNNVMILYGLLILTIILNGIFFKISYRDYAYKIITIYNLKQSKIEVDASTKNINAFNLEKITDHKVTSFAKGIAYYFDIVKKRLQKMYVIHYYSIILRLFIAIGFIFFVLHKLPFEDESITFVMKIYSAYAVFFYVVMNIEGLHIKNHYNFDIYLQQLNLLKSHIKELVSLKEKFYIQFFSVPSLILSSIASYCYYVLSQSISWNILLVFIGCLVLSYLIIKVSILEIYTHFPFILDILIYRKGYRMINFGLKVMFFVAILVNVIGIPGFVFIAYFVYYIWLKIDINQKN